MKRSVFAFATGFTTDFATGFIMVSVCGLAIGCSSSPKKQDAAAGATTPAASTSSTPQAATADTSSTGKGKKTSGKSSGNMAAAVEGSVVNCTSGDDKRSIELRSKDAGCEVLYTKTGESKSVANETSGSDYCKKTVEKIQANLTTAGFSCK